MAKDILTLGTLLGLINLKSAYLLGYAWVFGMSIWVTFFGGVIAYKTLPRQHFSNLQHKTFPIYFVLSIVTSSGLLGLWTFAHPKVQISSNLKNPLIADVLQFYTLLAAALMQSLNYFVIGPMTSKTMFERQKLEKEEGKSYNDPGVSEKMKSLNKRFMRLHGYSSLANLDTVIAFAFHGLWIANYGLGHL